MSTSRLRFNNCPPVTVYEVKEYFIKSIPLLPASEGIFRRALGPHRRERYARVTNGPGKSGRTWEVPVSNLRIESRP